MTKQTKRRAYAEMLKGGKYTQNYEVVVPIPGREMPHRTGKEFATERQAFAWIDSPEGTDLIDKIMAKYRR